MVNACYKGTVQRYQTPWLTCSMIFSGVGNARKKCATHRKANGLAMLSYLRVHLVGGRAGRVVLSG